MAWGEMGPCQDIMSCVLGAVVVFQLCSGYSISLVCILHTHYSPSHLQASHPCLLASGHPLCSPVCLSLPFWPTHAVSRRHWLLARIHEGMYCSWENSLRLHVTHMHCAMAVATAFDLLIKLLCKAARLLRVFRDRAYVRCACPFALYVAGPVKSL